MIRKITGVAVVALLLGSVGIASAQTNTHAAQVNGVRQAPFAASYQAPYGNSYFNQDYWRAIAPNGLLDRPDPYVGTVWEGVAPY
jgi:hypothetical protein